MNAALVFDVGGSITRAALYDAASDRLLSSDRRLTPTHLAHPDAEAPQLVSELFDLMHEQALTVSNGAVPSHIGIAFAGPISSGTILRAPTVWGELSGKPVQLRALAAERWPGRQIYVCNDVTAAGYRYLRTPSEDFCIVTVSSGIGHKVFIGGRPAVGPHGRGGEIGHLTIDHSPGAPLCDCGGRGHLAALTCGRATTYQTTRLVQRGDVTLDEVATFFEAGQVNNRRFAEAFRAGHPAASLIVDCMAAPLGRALCMMHLTVGFERACVIGGFGLALGQRYIERLAVAAAAAGWETGLDWSAVLELGEPDDDAALIGLGRALAWRVPESS
jgi:glucokinase